MPQSSMASFSFCVIGLAAGLPNPRDGGLKDNDDGVLGKLIRFADETQPFSWRAAATAAVCVLCALALRWILPFDGPEVPFAMFFPAVLLTGLLAGTPAALAAGVASAAAAYWLFMTPAFGVTNGNLAAALGLWAVSAAALILFAHHGRQVILRLRRSQREQELIAKELEHRGRNTYAVIQTIVQQTLSEQPDAAEAILGRIRAVKYAHDLILNQPAHSLFLDAVLAYELTPYGLDRCALEGPEIALSPDRARHLILVLHELATNAAKHGALSRSEGRVHVSWRRLGDDAVELRWDESGAPPPERQRTRKGFGTKLIAQCLRTLGGDIDTSFAEGGIAHLIRFDLR